MSYLYKLFILSLLTLNLHAFEGLISEPVFNEQVYVKVQGNPDNETIVFVHGLGNEASAVWNTTVEKLKDEYYIITFDLSGFGNSSRSKQSYTIPNYSKLLSFLTNTYCTKPFYLVGHSMGGAIALHFTSQNSEQVKKLMLIDVAGVLHKEAYSKSLIASKLNSHNSNETNDGKLITFTSLLMNKMQSFFSMSDVIEYGSTEVVAAYSLGIEDFGDIIPKINVPTFILWGAQDTIAPLRTGYSLNKFLSHSVLKIIPNAGHVPMTDAFKSYFLYVKEFLEEPISIKPKNISLAQYDEVLRLDNQENMLISGKYKVVVLNNCRNVVIENSHLNKIEMFNSSVHIQHSIINTNDEAIVMRNSSLMLSASDIFASTGIVANSSRLDIAGSNFYSNTKMIQNAKAGENTYVIFSISQAIYEKEHKILHGSYVLTHSQGL